MNFPTFMMLFCLFFTVFGGTVPIISIFERNLIVLIFFPLVETWLIILILLWWWELEKLEHETNIQQKSEPEWIPVDKPFTTEKKRKKRYS